MKIWKHFKTITYHKYLVMQGCFKVGLYWQGIFHDMSKYSPSEFWVGAKYYQGNRSPNNAEREAIGYSSSWLHHKGRNKHHYEYWIDYSTKDIAGGMAPEQVAFIHNANTDVQKKELFAKVRSGQVRVLIGSTSKMGAGTNVQDRLIALHDLDCPWVRLEVA